MRKLAEAIADYDDGRVDGYGQLFVVNGGLKRRWPDVPLHKANGHGDREKSDCGPNRQPPMACSEKVGQRKRKGHGNCRAKLGVSVGYPHSFVAHLTRKSSAKPCSVPRDVGRTPRAAHSAREECQRSERVALRQASFAPLDSRSRLHPPPIGPAQSAAYEVVDCTRVAEKAAMRPTGCVPAGRRTRGPSPSPREGSRRATSAGGAVRFAARASGRAQGQPPLRCKG